MDMKRWTECDILSLLRLRSVEVSVSVGVWVESSSSSKKLSISSPAELKATKRVYSHPMFKQNLWDVELASMWIM